MTPKIKMIFNGKKFVCEYCKHRCFKEINMLSHIQVKHLGMNLFQCSSCAYKTVFAGRLTQHIDVHHSSVKYPCNQCDVLFSRIWKLKSHQRNVHDKSRYTCQECDKRFLSEKGLRNHILLDHQGEQHPCPHCHFQTGNLEYLRKHIKKHLFPCQLCIENGLIKNFKSTSSLETHIEKRHETKSFGCEKCKRRFPFRKSLTKHIRASHESGLYQCEKCEGNKSKRFKTEAKLKTHKYRFHDCRFICKQCNRRFKLSEDLDRHSQEKHGTYVKNRQKFECRFCEKYFLSKDGLDHHIASVHEEKKYTCNEEDCQYEGKRLFNLEIHYKNIHIEGKHYCKICHENGINKVFRKMFRLQAHIVNRHTKAANYDCTICGKLFTKKISLLRHKARGHIGDIFICSICNEKFTTKYKMKIHIKTDHKDDYEQAKNFPCYYCSKFGVDTKFLTENFLADHVKKYHNKKAQKDQFIDHNYAKSLGDDSSSKRKTFEFVLLSEKDSMENDYNENVNEKNPNELTTDI